KNEHQFSGNSSGGHSCRQHAICRLPQLETSVALCCDKTDGLVLGADTRATEGMIVADKNCSKIHYSLSTGHLPRVGTANRMLKQMLFRYQGHIGAALVLGGMDCNGPHLYSIYPHGSTDKLPYVTMGESARKYKQDLEEDAKRLVRDAIAAGIFNDLGSGSNIDLCVITNGRVDYLRPHDMANKKGVRRVNELEALPHQ
uniref:Proteasome 20S subunit beta 7 n=1 Tax=Oncorhynchus kisutch TaxID=8019 RepID=A0A8C7LEZ6_ONCKI